MTILSPIGSNSDYRLARGAFVRCKNCWGMLPSQRLRFIRRWRMMWCVAPSTSPH